MRGEESLPSSIRRFRKSPSSTEGETRPDAISLISLQFC